MWVLLFPNYFETLSRLCDKNYLFEEKIPHTGDKESLVKLCFVGDGSRLLDLLLGRGAGVRVPYNPRGGHWKEPKGGSWLRRKVGVVPGYNCTWREREIALPGRHLWLSRLSSSVWRSCLNIRWDGRIRSEGILPAPFCLPIGLHIVTLFWVVWLGALLVYTFAIIVRTLNMWRYIMVTRLVPIVGSSSVRIEMGWPYSPVPVGAALALLYLVVVGRLLLQLPAPREELLTRLLRHLGGSVNVEFSRHNEFSCSRSIRRSRILEFVTCSRVEILRSRE